MLQTAKQSFIKVYNLVVREFAQNQQKNNHEKYLPFFQGLDNFPVHLAELVQGSPTATSCLSTLADFIAGEGLSEGQEIENMMINRYGLKFQQFHNYCSYSLAHDWGVAAIVKYNRVGQITEIYEIPFGYCRLGIPDSNGLISKIKYNPYFGTTLYKQTETVEYDSFNPNAAVEQARDKNWKGQIAWAGIRTKANPFYPVPDYYSARKWMNIEKNAATYFDENLENGFLQSTIIKMLGDPNDPSGLTDKDGKDIPKGEAFDREMSENFQGTNRVAKVMAFWANNKDEFPTLEAFPTSGNPDMYRVQDEHATKKITIATKVPSILANISEGVSLGGDGNTIRAAVKLMQQRVKRQQAFLIDFYMSLFKHFVFPPNVPRVTSLTIVPYNPYPELESVDPQVWAELTPEERRKWVKDHTEIEIEDDEPPSTTPEARITNLYFNSYPEGARKTVQRALEWADKMGAKCLRPSGRQMSQAIIDGVPLGPREIKRLSRYLSKQVVHKDKQYSDSCDSLLFDAWGGSEMMIWANEKVKELNG